MGLIILFVNAIVSVLTFIVIIYTFLRFFMDPFHPVLHVLSQVIEPLLVPVRKRMPPTGGLDFSPLILIIGLQLLGYLIVALLRSFG